MRQRVEMVKVREGQGRVPVDTGVKAQPSQDEVYLHLAQCSHLWLPLVMCSGCPLCVGVGAQTEGIQKLPRGAASSR